MFECQFVVFQGDLSLVGSSKDGTRLYAPDECDISLVLSDAPKVKVRCVLLLFILFLLLIRVILCFKILI